MNFASRYNENSLSLSDLIKTTVSDVAYPVWPPGKAPWSLEKGGDGVPPSESLNSSEDFKDVKKPETFSQDLRPTSQTEAEKMIAKGKELVEMAVRSGYSGISPSAQNLLLANLNAILLKAKKS